MSTTRRLPSRRAFLGGAATCVALPWLASIANAGHALQHPRARNLARRAGELRFLAYYVPNGIHMPGWTPTSKGESYDVSPILQALNPTQGSLDLRPHVHVLSGLRNDPCRPDGAGDHAAGTAGFLTCTHIKKSETEIQNAISADQVFAQVHGEKTPIASVQLGIEGGDNAGNCDSGYGCAYSRNISWSDWQTPLPKITAPHLAFNLMFSGSDPSESAQEVEKRRYYRKSVLDDVKSEANALHAILGRDDREKVDEYLSGVRELERRIDAMTPSTCDTSNFLPDFSDYPGQLAVMNDLMVLAFSCDITRTITFMQGNAASGRSYDFIGVPGSHHDLSHHGGDAATQAMLQTINTWEIENFARLLARMASIQEADGTLLDNSLVLFSSEIEDGNSHSHANLPFLLAGHGAGRLGTGRHLEYTDGKVSDLYLSLLRASGATLDRFGDDSGSGLDGLFV